MAPNTLVYGLFMYNGTICISSTCILTFNWCLKSLFCHLCCSEVMLSQKTWDEQAVKEYERTLKDIPQYIKVDNGDVS